MASTYLWDIATCTGECTHPNMSHVVNSCRIEETAQKMLPEVITVLEFAREHTECEITRYFLLALARILNHHSIRQTVVRDKPVIIELLCHFAQHADRATIWRTASRCLSIAAQSPIPTSQYDSAIVSVIYKYVETSSDDARIQSWWGLNRFCRDSEKRTITLRNLATTERLRELATIVNIPWIREVYGVTPPLPPPSPPPATQRKK